MGPPGHRLLLLPHPALPRRHLLVPFRQPRRLPPDLPPCPLLHPSVLLRRDSWLSERHQWGTLPPPSLLLSSALLFCPLNPLLPSAKVRRRPLQLLHCLCFPSLLPVGPFRPPLIRPARLTLDPGVPLSQAPLRLPSPLPRPPVLFYLPFLHPPRCATGLRALLHVRLWLHALVRRQGRVHHPHRRVWWRREW